MTSSRFRRGLRPDDGAFVKSAGLAKVPAFDYVHLGGTLGSAAEGWDPNARDDAVEHLAKEVA